MAPSLLCFFAVTKKPHKSINRGLSVAKNSAALAARRGRAVDLPEQHVRVRAYFLSLQRDNGSPDPVADWLRAERELTVEESGRSS